MLSLRGGKKHRLRDQARQKIIIKAEKLADDITYYEQLENLSDFIHKYFVEIVYTSELYDGAKEVLEWIHSNGHKIIFVTSRAYQSGADTEEDTIKYLKDNHIQYYNIYLRTPDKLDVCLKEKIYFLNTERGCVIWWLRACTLEQECLGLDQVLPLIYYLCDLWEVTQPL